MGLQFSASRIFHYSISRPFVGLLFWYLVRWKKQIAKKIGDPKTGGRADSNLIHALKFLLKIYRYACRCRNRNNYAIINPQFLGKWIKWRTEKA